MFVSWIKFGKKPKTWLLLFYNNPIVLSIWYFFRIVSKIDADRQIQTRESTSNRMIKSNQMYFSCFFFCDENSKKNNKKISFVCKIKKISIQSIVQHWVFKFQKSLNFIWVRFTVFVCYFPINLFPAKINAK